MGEQHSRSWRREIAALTVWALLLLALINVGWSCWFAQYGEHSRSMYDLFVSERAGISIDPDDPSVLNIAYCGSTRVETRYLLIRDYMFRRAADLAEAGEDGATTFEQMAPRWLRRRHARLKGTVSTGNSGEVSTLIGWPARLLWCTWKSDPRGWAVMRDTAIELDPPIAPPPTGSGAIQIRPSFSRALPYRPVLSGQLVNAVLCAGIVLLVRQGSRAAGRWRRRRAGRCASCNYDLRGNISGVCPECGADAKARR